MVQIVGRYAHSYRAHPFVVTDGDLNLIIVCPFNSHGFHIIPHSVYGCNRYAITINVKIIDIPEMMTHTPSNIKLNRNPVRRYRRLFMCVYYKNIR
jgi:hypothetical protein